MSMKKACLSIAGVVSLSVALLSPVVANAAPTNDNTKNYEQFTEFLNDNGVTEEVQQSLVEKVSAGEILDSAKGINPVSETSYEESGNSITRAVFPDGSITVVTAQIPTESPGGGIMPFGTIFNGCKATTGSGWATFKGCNVQGDNGQAFLKFKVDYERYNGAHAKILRTYDAKSGSTIGWNTTAAKRTKWVPQSSIGAKAHAKYHTRTTNVIGAGSFDFYTGFYLDYKGNWSVLL